MQNRVVIKVATKDYRDKEKAKAIALGFPGVISAEFMTGYDYRNMMIICEDLDFTALCYKLRKKVGYTEQVSMIPMKQELSTPPPQTIPLQAMQMTTPMNHNASIGGPISARSGAPPICEALTAPMNHNGAMDPLPTIGTPVSSITSSAPSPMDTPLAQRQLSHASAPCHRVHPLNDSRSVAPGHQSIHASTPRQSVRLVAPDHHHPTHASTHQRLRTVVPDHHSTHASTHQRVDSVTPKRHYTYANTPHQHGYQWSRQCDNYHDSGEEWGYCSIM